MSRQSQAIERVLRAAQGRISADLTVRLWDGATIEYSRSDAENIVVEIGSADAVRTMLLRPGVATLFELYGRGDLRILNGSPLMLLRAFDHVSVNRFVKDYGRLNLLGAALPFLFKEGGSFSPRAFLGRWTGAARDDRKMIEFHYDVANEFYKLFLDNEMVYTCAYFRDWDYDIHQAQRDKLEHVCRKLRLKPGDRMLDIGCGWGSLTMYAAETYGVIAKGVTLSKDQHDLANEWIQKRGLADRVTVELRDFRDLPERSYYDKIASLGMFEHVGRENFDAYFQRVHELLRPRGLYLHHAITRRVTPDLSKFDKQTGYQKAITRFIFPGGELDYIGRTVTNMERKGFEVHDVEALREHYRLTLTHSHDRLWANREEAARIAGEEVLRLWLLYFALFVIGFERGVVNLFQTLGTKRRLGLSGLPSTREDMYDL